MKQVRIETLAASQMVSHDAFGTVAMESTPNRARVAEAGPEIIQSVSTEVALDALKSFDPEGEELDYKSHVIRGAAALRGCDTPARRQVVKNCQSARTPAKKSLVSGVVARGPK